MPDWAIQILKQQSPTVLIVLLVVWVLGRYIAKQHKTHLDSKEKEIDRLVKERDKLQEILLKTERLSTQDDQRKPKKDKNK